MSRVSPPFNWATYRNVFILDSRDWFAVCCDRFDPATDLVLTYDLALKLEVESRGGKALFVDHLISSEVMQENNFLLYEFFRGWHVDGSGVDFFVYRGVPFGFSFRLDIWNELVFYVRARLCLEAAAQLRFVALFVGTELGLAESILAEMGVSFVLIGPDRKALRPRYYFPIHQWMTESVRRRGLKSCILNIATWGIGTLFSWWDRAHPQSRRRPAVFVQPHYPTFGMIQRLRDDRLVNVVTASMSKRALWSRFVPVGGRVTRFQSAAEECLERLRRGRVARLVLSTGLDVSDGAYRIIEKVVAPRVAASLRTLDCVLGYLDKNPIGLELLIANIGELVALVDCVCRARGVPSYLVINGFMTGDYLDESKYATVINSYSLSIKQHYFRGMENIVCLGDPRMDDYPPLARPCRVANGDVFAVAIGASGHNNVDLNSYVAVEFDFLNDVLIALRHVKMRGAKLKIVLKVRANGYRRQYEQFVAEYFPGLVDEIVDKRAMREVLTKSDFYISIYSQTLFEASCLGVPCVYFKKDNEVLDAPFDGKSELVTVDSVAGLVQAVEDARIGHERYDAFLRRSVMERYIGPLDGGNLQRNVEYLYSLLDPMEVHLEGSRTVTA